MGEDVDFFNSCYYDYFIFQGLLPQKLSASSVFPVEHNNDSDQWAELE